MRPAPARHPLTPVEPFNLDQTRFGLPGLQGHRSRPIRISPSSATCFSGAAVAPAAPGFPSRYPIVEALTGILSALVGWYFGYTFECAGALILTWSLIALSFIDLDHQLLPDSITIPLLWLGLALGLT